MPHEHHGHAHAPASLSRVFLIAFAINIVFAGLEAFFGWRVHSLALLSDAGHNLADTLNLALSGIAVWAAGLRPSERYTYGFRRAPIFAAFANALFLVLSSVFILYEGFVRLSAPVPTEGITVMAVAAAGILVNGLSAWLLLRAGGDKDINVRSAYLHLFSDALVSVGVVVSGALVLATGWYAFDSVASIIVSLLMLVGAVPLLRESLRMAFDAVPSSVDRHAIESAISGATGVASYHHLHIWPLSTTESALTVHVELLPGADAAASKRAIRHELSELDIGHATIETESGGCDTPSCSGENAHPDHDHDGHDHAHEHGHGDDHSH
jgi:cobalt-zinc-cadmium efflux system protein